MVAIMVLLVLSMIGALLLYNSQHHAWGGTHENSVASYGISADSYLRGANQQVDNLNCVVKTRSGDFFAKSRAKNNGNVIDVVREGNAGEMNCHGLGGINADGHQAGVSYDEDWSPLSSHK
jgi:hypothetical protein